MPVKLLRSVSCNRSVLSDGILVFSIDSGFTSLLPKSYGQILDHIDNLPWGQCFPEEKVVPNEMCIGGALVSEIRQLMIDVGVVSVC